MSANIFFLIGIFLMTFATYNISRLYNIEQKSYGENNEKTNIESRNSNIISEIFRQMAAIYYIAAFCVPIVIISLISNIIGNSQIALGVVIGSNISLLLLCRGISYMTKSVRRIMNGNIMFLVVVSVVLLFLANDTVIDKRNSLRLLSTYDGIIMLIFGISYVIIKIWKNKAITKMEDDYQIESYKQNEQFNVDKVKINIKDIMHQIKHKGKLVFYLVVSIVGAILYVWNLTETSIYFQIGQSKVSLLVSGTLLMTLLITSYYIAKNVDSVEKNVDNEEFLLKKVQNNVDNNKISGDINHENTRTKKFYIQKKIENMDKIEEENIILIGIVGITLIIGVSSIVHDIHISLYVIKNMVFLCAIYITYSLMSNLPNRWDRIKGSLMVTCFIGYVIYEFIFS